MKDSPSSNRAIAFVRGGGMRSAIALLLVVLAGAIAILDVHFRPDFFELAKIGLAGYLGQLVPRSSKIIE